MSSFKKLLWALNIALVLALIGCGQKDSRSESQAPAPMSENTPAALEDLMAREEAMPQEKARAMSESTIAAKSKADNTVQTNQPEVSTTEKLGSGMFGKEILSRQFIFTANLQFRVKDVYKSAIEIENLVYSLDGFVLNNDIRANVTQIQELPQSDNTILQTTAYRTSGELVVRLPAANTQEFLRKLEPNIDYLDKRHFSARDVQFDILRQKLGYQRAQETQRNYGQSIAQTKGDNRIDAIDSQDRTKAIRDNAIVTQAIFEDQVAYSTINLNLYQLEKIRQDKIVDVSAIIESNRPSFFASLKIALIDGWYGFLSLLVALASIWPLWIVALVIFFIVRKGYRQSRRNKHQAKQNKEEQK